MFDFMELARVRQSCRKFTGAPVEQEKLVKLVEAGRIAPSGCNAQPWRFVAVSTPELVRGVALAAQQTGNEFTNDAGAFIVVLEEHAKLMPSIRRMVDSQYFAKGDIGGATAYIALQAASLGLGTCQIGMFDREALCNLLGLDEAQRFGALLAVGYPADPVIRAKKRKPLEDIMILK